MLDPITKGLKVPNVDEVMVPEAVVPDVTVFPTLSHCDPFHLATRRSARLVIPPLQLPQGSVTVTLEDPTVLSNIQYSATET